MSATASPRHAQRSITHMPAIVSAALIGVALATLIWAAAMTFVRDRGPAVEFDPTGAQRSQLIREYGSAASYDASGALQFHVLRENGSD